MKKLLLLRHARALPSGGVVSDFERGLHRMGITNAMSIGDIILEKKIKPEIIFSSSAKRAKMTSEIVSERCGAGQKIIFLDRLYHAAVGDYLEIISGVNDLVASVLIVGHNPVVMEFISEYTGYDVEMFPCNLVLVKMKMEKWNGIPSRSDIIAIDKYTSG